MTHPIYRQTRSVRMHDVDAAGSLFYGRIFEFFLDAYIDHLRQKGISVAEAFKTKSFVAPVVHVEADYREPLRFMDNFIVEISSAELMTSSIRIHYAIRSADSPPRLHATALVVHVYRDPKTFESIPIPDGVRAAFQSLPERAEKEIA